MGLARVLGVCAAILFASSVGAVTIDVGPSDYKSFGPSGAHTGVGIRSTFSQSVRLPPSISGPTRILPVSRNPVVPYASAAARMRPFTSIHPVSVAASAAVTGLFLAMEWYFDEEIGEWSVREAEETPPIHDTGWRYTALPECGASPLFPSPTAACQAGAACLGMEVVELGRDGDMRFMCSVERPGIDYRFPVVTNGIECHPGATYNVIEGVCEEVVPVPVSQGEYSKLAGQLPALPAGSVADATGDAQRRFGEAPGYQDTQMSGPSSVTGPETTSTSTDPVTGDTTVTSTSTTTNFNYGDESITSSDTTTTTTYQNGQETSTTVTTETPGELPVSTGGDGAVGEWPAFCDWASVVCDWLNWTQEEPPSEQDLPAVIDDDFFEEKRISFGAKSCPPPHEVNLAPFLSTTVGVSFQPLCDFAGLIYYMVMAASYIIAAYISIGVARNG